MEPTVSGRETDGAQVSSQKALLVPSHELQQLLSELWMVCPLPLLTSGLQIEGLTHPIFCIFPPGHLLTPWQREQSVSLETNPQSLDPEQFHIMAMIPAASH